MRCCVFWQNLKLWISRLIHVITFIKGHFFIQTQTYKRIYLTFSERFTSTLKVHLTLSFKNKRERNEGRRKMKLCTQCTFNKFKYKQTEPSIQISQIVKRNHLMTMSRPNLAAANHNVWREGYGIQSLKVATGPRIQMMLLNIIIGF